MNPTRILVIGAGGREHALAWRLARDPHAPYVLVAPGNEGIAAGFPVFPLVATDPAAVVKLAREQDCDLVVIGPESALAAGVADALGAAGIAVFGASRAAARLESSKWFAKQVMLAADVPTAGARVFEQLEPLLAALAASAPPYVLKADGLAAGKGVWVTSARAEAAAFAKGCLAERRFGENGARVVLEEFLVGEEASVIAICDGGEAFLLPAARDHKRAFAGELGPNTGGMGAYAPSAAVTPAIEREVSERIVGPVLRELAARGTPFRGALYVGLMLTAAGPRVVEFNARFGDPETQATLPLLAGSLSSLLASAAAGRLDGAAITRAPGAALTVALVAEGYPDAVGPGGDITGLDALAADPELLVYYSAASREQGKWRVTGGRAAYVGAQGDSLRDAGARVQAALSTLGGHGWRYRADIAAPAPTPEHAGGR